MTVFTTARCIQSTPSHPISLRSILLLISHLCHVFPQVFWWKFLYAYEGVSKSFRTGRRRLQWELQMVQLSATRCSCIAILWVSLVSFAAITFCIASERVFIVVYFVIDSVRKLLDTPPDEISLRADTHDTMPVILSIHLLPKHMNGAEPAAAVYVSDTGSH
jgi:hypothetical protein